MTEPSSEGLRGKCIVAIGPGGSQKLRHYAALRYWGVCLVIVCSELDPPLDGRYADRVVVIDGLYDHGDELRLASSIVRSLARVDVRPDGILTLWEDCAPLVAQVAALIGLPSVDPVAARTAKSKLETQRVLAAAAGRGPGSRLHVRTRECNTSAQLDAASAAIGLPALIKLEHGSSAAAVVPVHTPAAARDTWATIQRMLRSEHDYPGIGLGFGGLRVVLSELLDGTEHDVDLVLWQGETRACFVTDNGRTRLPSCAETSAVMPSTASSATVARLVESAQAACTQLGLTTGVFNIELIDTAEGVRVIDVNGRMGGLYIRDWVLELWGYDLLESAARCCTGSPPGRCTDGPRGSIIGAMLSPSVHGDRLADPEFVRRLRATRAEPGVTLFEFENELRVHDLIDEPWGMLAVRRESPTCAKATLLAIWDNLGLGRSDPVLPSLLPTVA